MSSIIYHAIGTFHSKQVNPYDAGRQPDSLHSPGIIELNAKQNFEQALKGLDAFSHIWVIFQFHHNENWKPQITPPRGSKEKVGVFASRAPYRPNNIGMSVVKLEKIEGLKIFISEADLLDGSPILDIKPYIAYADSKPEASMGWIDESEKFQIQFSEESEKQIQWLANHNVLIKSFIQHQLEFDPVNDKKKRVKKIAENSYVLAYRTWRIEFTLSDLHIEIEKIYSGYSESDLEKKEDPYGDKDLHQQFKLLF